uniref:Uncharacterized protein n=1 Tax=Meloidogyne incognita TaxID=6306 RepID=A0A914KFF3_MELIC
MKVVWKEQNWKIKEKNHSTFKRPQNKDKYSYTVEPRYTTPLWEIVSCKRCSLNMY